MAMEHSYIEEHSLIERYHQGRLPPELEERFEEHFVGCRQCTEQLEAARGFERGFKAMVAQDLSRATAAGVLSWLARRGRWAQLGVLAAVLMLAVAVPSWWLVGERQELRRVAERERVASEDWRQRFEDQQRRTAALEQRLTDRESRWEEERQQLAERLDEASSAARRGVASAAARLAKPLINTPVFVLGLLRGDEPSATLALADVDDELVLAVDAGDDPRVASYRAILGEVGGDELWRGEELVPNALEVLMMTFPASFFHAGDYRLVIEGRAAGGELVPVGAYRFRVTE